MDKIKHIAVLTAIALGLIVILQNMQSVETRFLFFEVTMPNAVLLSLTLLVGMVIGALLMLIRSGRKKDAGK